MGKGCHEGPPAVTHAAITDSYLARSNLLLRSVLGVGRQQLRIAAISVACGENLRVGLEDSLWIGPGRLAESNAQQVRAARQIIEQLGLDVGSPADAREILALKGGDQVAFQRPKRRKK